MKITKALDVHPESADEEIDRKRNALQVIGPGSFDLVTLKTVLKVTNFKKESVHMKVTRPFTEANSAWTTAGRKLRRT